METLNQLLSIELNYIIIGLIVVFFTIEQVVTTQFNYSKRPHHLFNNALFMVVFFIGNIFWAAFAVFSIEWLYNQHIGLFHLIDLPVWLKLILGVAMIDMVTYWFHRMSHRIPLLWRFHRVHHSDTSMDSSTYFRSHPFELIFWFGTSNIIAAAIFGLDLVTLGVYFLVGTPFFIIEHTNLRFPRWVDKTFGLVFTTPNIHKVHHEKDQFYTDSNYADIFILWDRLFGTYQYKPAEELQIGLDEFDDDKKQSFWYLIKSPFLNVKRVNTNEKLTTDQPELQIIKTISQKHLPQ
ncbi:MAG: sterol desaturase family protein [Chitinophagaceae bacterium]|jgi:sterol desaturase/sphingolipid hydroxylase (fatty acid hydroxylase superfamily)|nr:sterol desaturase family protein [Chitinophagaceae bacterium]